MSRDQNDREDFASRWSRRKRAARTAPAEPEKAPEPEAGADEALSDEQILEEMGLPDPDALKPGDDVSAFMASAVPARLRNRALRRLWVSNRLLANLDGLIDYGEDYTDAAMVPEVLNTAYRAGRGWAEDEEPQDRGAENGGAENEAPQDGPAEAAGEGDGTGAVPAAEAPPAPDKAPERSAPAPAGAGAEAPERGTDKQLAEDTSAEDTSAEGTSAPEADRAEADRPGRPQARRALPRRMRFRFSDS